MESLHPEPSTGDLWADLALSQKCSRAIKSHRRTGKGWDGMGWDVIMGWDNGMGSADPQGSARVRRGAGVCWTLHKLLLIYQLSGK